MKRIKAVNGYTIYQYTERDEKREEGTAGNYAIFFSSDIRDFGVSYSSPEWDDIETIEEAMEYIKDEENIIYCKARELCESESTCVSYEDIEEKVEEIKNSKINLQEYANAEIEEFEERIKELEEELSNVEELAETPELEELNNVTADAIKNKITKLKEAMEEAKKDILFK